MIGPFGIEPWLTPLLYHKQLMLKALIDLYHPSDTRDAHVVYGANCGPCAFAAFVRRNVGEVMQLFPHFPEKQFTNVPAMERALRGLGLFWEKKRSSPKRGLLLVTGPQKYYSRHWIAVEGDFVYEVGLDMWVPFFLWKRDFRPVLAADLGIMPDELTIEIALEVEKPDASLAFMPPAARISCDRGLSFEIDVVRAV